MKFGHSILLGEIIEAERLQYRDCERFQVVCPQCNEPIFKVRRSPGSEQEMHYLAHYASAKAYQGECELRVKGMSKADIAQSNKVSRDQRLAYFMSVLRRTIGMSPLYAEGAEKTHWRLNKSAAIELLRDLVWEQTILPNREAMFDEGSGDYLWHLDHEGWAMATTFSLERQRQIARDMWLMITTPAGHGNYNFLWNHAFLRELNKILGTIERLEGLPRQVSETMAGYMARVAEARKSDLDGLLGAMSAHYLPEDYNKIQGVDDTSGDRSNYFSRMLSNITIEMIGTLLELPYFELLKQQYGDPGKIYPYQPGVEPVDPEEIDRMKEFQARHRSQRGAH